jgi:hypothetical protein
MKRIYIVFGLLMILFSCSNDNDWPIPQDESFLPMQIGNYWKIDDDNFTEITDTLRIQGEVYYKFYSLIGRDAIGIDYLRIDDEQNLVGSNPDYPNFRYTHAKFDASVGETFWTMGNQSINDFKVTLTEKNDNLRTFEHHRFYQNHEEKLFISYTRGLGWNFNYYLRDFKEIKINGVVYRF